MNAWFEALTGLALRESAWWLLAVLPVLAWALWRQRRDRPAAVAFAPAALLAAPLPATWRTRCRWLPAGLTALAVALLLLALLRPVRRVELEREQQGIDIVLCLDTSSSMAVVEPDTRLARLETARAAAASFALGRPHDRIGLVAFARFPDLVCPPTQDQQALLQLLGAVQLVERDGQEDATGIGLAVARAVRALATSPPGGRVVILVTDGEENVAAAGTPDEIGPLQAAQLAIAHGVRVHTLAVGTATAGAPLDPTQVRELAERTGGRFFAAGDAAAQALVWRAIDELERAPFATPRHRLDDRYLGFAVAAFLALALAFVLQRTWLEVMP